MPNPAHMSGGRQRSYTPATPPPQPKNAPTTRQVQSQKQPQTPGKTQQPANNSPPQGNNHLPFGPMPSPGSLPHPIRHMPVLPQPLVDEKPKQVWWPNHTTPDRQLITIGEPFMRKGEKLIVETTPSGALKSRTAL